MMEEKYSYTLVYDDSCPFCSGLAQRIGKYAGVKTVPANRSPKFGGIPKSQLMKDVHLIKQVKYAHGQDKHVYVGASAAAKVISIKHPLIWTLYNFVPFNICFRSLYFVLKKSRKYLAIVWSI